MVFAVGFFCLNELSTGNQGRMIKKYRKGADYERKLVNQARSKGRENKK